MEGELGDDHACGGGIRPYHAGIPESIIRRVVIEHSDLARATEHDLRLVETTWMREVHADEQIGVKVVVDHVNQALDPG